ncbi:hypothetical protein ROV31_06010 [Pasteurella multocida]|uniref:hypothetical protein n=1 Tax=Pasteurella multocida TaxID=747 RepID=UPI002BC36418|nr:hypothetical protein [Pasteurella multocida]MEB3470128.1 hypothetical protein [Pasteurella multocida]
MAKTYSITLRIKVSCTEEDLEIKTAFENGVLTQDLQSTVDELMVTLVAFIQKNWWCLESRYPEISQGFEEALTFFFAKDEEGDWAVKSSVDEPETLAATLLGMTKLFFTGDPALDEFL